MRTIINLPDSDRETLDKLCRKLGISHAEAVRRAVSEYLQAHRTVTDDELFGIWRDHDEDALAYEDRVRADWQGR